MSVCEMLSLSFHYQLLTFTVNDRKKEIRSGRLQFHPHVVIIVVHNEVTFFNVMVTENICLRIPRSIYLLTVTFTDAFTSGTMTARLLSQLLLLVRSESA